MASSDATNIYDNAIKPMAEDEDESASQSDSTLVPTVVMSAPQAGGTEMTTLPHQHVDNLTVAGDECGLSRVPELAEDAQLKEGLDGGSINSTREVNRASFLCWVELCVALS